MGKNYEDWADWAGDHPEEAEAQLKAQREARSSISLNHGLALAGILPSSMDDCPHAEVDTQGVCEGCGIEVPGWEPDDAQLLSQSGTKEPTPIMLGVTSVETLPTGIYAAINVREDVAERIRAMYVPGISIEGRAV